MSLLLHTPPKEVPIAKLDCDTSFSLLELNEKLYAHYLSEG